MKSIILKVIIIFVVFMVILNLSSLLDIIKTKDGGTKIANVLEGRTTTPAISKEDVKVFVDADGNHYLELFGDTIRLTTGQDVLDEGIETLDKLGLQIGLKDKGVYVLKYQNKTLLELKIGE